MLRWLFNVLIGSTCNHFWESTREEWVPPVYANSYVGFYRQHLRCKKCGERKIKEMR
jgi:hypothetical protein